MTSDLPAPPSAATSTPVDEPGVRGKPAPRRVAAAAVAVFALLTIAYHANGEVLPGNDAKPSLYVPVSLLDDGDLAFTVEEAPFMFRWRFADPAERARGEPYPSAELLTAGKLELLGPRYYLTPSVLPGTYVSTFGIGAGMTALPLVAALKLVRPDTWRSPRTLWFAGKTVAALAVAGSAVFVLLAALFWCELRAATGLALAYGLGTCVWSLSSQALWQHGPNELFLAMGAWLLIRCLHGKERSALWCGAALAAAVVCRPTSAIVVLAVALTLALTDRRALVRFMLGGAPLALLLFLYQWQYLGSPFASAQLAQGHEVALAKTGDASLWQTPLWYGAVGLLLSPSRGLFVYSPFLLFALPSFVTVFRRARFFALRPMALATCGALVVASSWFDWWGGWCFGYRPLVDTAPFLALLLVPAVELVRRRRVLALVAALSVAWSIAVQLVGAFAYDVTGWNNRPLPPQQFDAVFEDHHTTRLSAPDADHASVQASALGAVALMTTEDVDLPPYRRRLWSIVDAQLVHYLRELPGARASKRAQVERQLALP